MMTSCYTMAILAGRKQYFQAMRLKMNEGKQNIVLQSYHAKWQNSTIPVTKNSIRKYKKTIAHTI